MTHVPERLPDEDLSIMLLIREFELLLLDLFGDGLISGTTHTCLGQEYIPVAMMPLLGQSFVFGNHRSHGHYLAQFRDPAGLLAEILGRTGGVCGGRGGSQHIYRDGFCSTGVQGEGVSAALGAALTMRRLARGNLAVAYIGDGTWGEGVVYETLNMAQLWQAPLAIIVENNGIAQSTPIEQAMAGTIEDRAAAFGTRYNRVTESCPLAIRRQLANDVEITRHGGGPLVVEFITQRLGSHSKGDDTRSSQQRKALEERDWLRQYRASYSHQVQQSELDQRGYLRRLTEEILARPQAEV
jgi:TPP-dependent pyruvate/acetoin dehydrogenase alpha subunit